MSKGRPSNSLPDGTTHYGVIITMKDLYDENHPTTPKTLKNLLVASFPGGQQEAIKKKFTRPFLSLAGVMIHYWETGELKECRTSPLNEHFEEAIREYVRNNPFNQEREQAQEEEQEQEQEEEEEEDGGGGYVQDEDEDETVPSALDNDGGPSQESKRNIVALLVLVAFLVSFCSQGMNFDYTNLRSSVEIIDIFLAPTARKVDEWMVDLIPSFRSNFTWWARIFIAYPFFSTFLDLLLSEFNKVVPHCTFPIIIQFIRLYGGSLLTAVGIAGMWLLAYLKTAKLGIFVPILQWMLLLLIEMEFRPIYLSTTVNKTSLEQQIIPEPIHTNLQGQLVLCATILLSVWLALRHCFSQSKECMYDVHRTEKQAQSTIEGDPSLEEVHDEQQKVNQTSALPLPPPPPPTTTTTANTTPSRLPASIQFPRFSPSPLPPPPTASTTPQNNVQVNGKQPESDTYNSFNRVTAAGYGSGNGDTRVSPPTCTISTASPPEDQRNLEASQGSPARKKRSFNFNESTGFTPAKSKIRAPLCSTDPGVCRRTPTAFNQNVAPASL